ncbi:hypothetical protein [Bacillus haynesii]|uniref:hypothetical protein n=1 Tax=Bacillus haynesii TaxID=1925021 RepID=UPI00227ED7AE|nr:hypothetical protein [Bacillus haynesii]MCY9372744.1 hypothetical protein [Bacillus haynesii]
MSWLEFVSSIINSWPLAIIIIVILLRKSLLNKLGNLLNLTYKDININFQEELNKANKSLGETDSENEPVENDEIDIIDLISDMAYINPSSAIIASWVYFERKLSELLEEEGIKTEGLSFYEKQQYLSLRQLIDDNIFGSINKLRKLFDEVKDASGKSSKISTIVAFDYSHLTLKTLRKILILKGGE